MFKLTLRVENLLRDKRFKLKESLFLNNHCIHGIITIFEIFKSKRKATSNLTSYKHVKFFLFG